MSTFSRYTPGASVISPPDAGSASTAACSAVKRCFVAVIVTVPGAASSGCTSWPAKAGPANAVAANAAAIRKPITA